MSVPLSSIRLNNPQELQFDQISIPLAKAKGFQTLAGHRVRVLSSGLIPSLNIWIDLMCETAEQVELCIRTLQQANLFVFNDPFFSGQHFQVYFDHIESVCHITIIEEDGTEKTDKIFKRTQKEFRSDVLGNIREELSALEDEFVSELDEAAFAGIPKGQRVVTDEIFDEVDPKEREPNPPPEF